MEDFSVLCKGNDYNIISDYSNILITCVDSIFKVYYKDSVFQEELKVLNSIKSFPIPNIKSHGDFEGKKYIELELNAFATMLFID
jgi:hypothetical protein